MKTLVQDPKEARAGQLVDAQKTQLGTAVWVKIGSREFTITPDDAARLGHKLLHASAAIRGWIE